MQQSLVFRGHRQAGLANSDIYQRRERLMARRVVMWWGWLSIVTLYHTLTWLVVYTLVGGTSYTRSVHLLRCYIIVHDYLTLLHCVCRRPWWVESLRRRCCSLPTSTCVILTARWPRVDSTLVNWCTFAPHISFKCRPTYKFNLHYTRKVSLHYTKMFTLI